MFGNCCLQGNPGPTNLSSKRGQKCTMRTTGPPNLWTSMVLTTSISQIKELRLGGLSDSPKMTWLLKLRHWIWISRPSVLRESWCVSGKGHRGYSSQMRRSSAFRLFHIPGSYGISLRNLDVATHESHFQALLGKREKPELSERWSIERQGS